MVCCWVVCGGQNQSNRARPNCMFIPGLFVGGNCLLNDGTVSVVRSPHSPCLPAGNTATNRQDFPLPDPPASVEASGGFNYPNSNGFQFEAVAIHKCIREGRTLSDQYTPNEMMAVRTRRATAIISSIFVLYKYLHACRENTNTHTTVSVVTQCCPAPSRRK